MADASNSEEWKTIAEKIANETDSDKLTQLVNDLSDALDPKNRRNTTRYESNRPQPNAPGR